MNALPVSTSAARATAVLTSVVLTLVLTGCASGSGSFDGDPAAQQGSPTQLVAEQLRDIEGASHSAYEAIQSLRPQWLRIRSTPSLTLGTLEPVVYVDGLRYGYLGSLRNIDTSNVDRMTYIPGLDATTRYGTDHGGGVIEIYLR